MSSMVYGDQDSVSLYDCVMLFKANVAKDRVANFLSDDGEARLSVERRRPRHQVLRITRLLGSFDMVMVFFVFIYAVVQDQLMQMTMMAIPNISKELHYLNKEDCLLGWLLSSNTATSNLAWMELMTSDGKSKGFPSCSPTDRRRTKMTIK
ncbi:hypothetical protein MLD38_036941 [Melastoma candidum]|uniref:Uncharacterized protein n=1 Tax=Melastoma candidum TaxID=119954 RepID=A0ACB9LLS1_9MYRT|nr:hypothetical protein MLD38_036941 [Melastoma candidum]